MILARSALVEEHVVPEDGTLGMIEAPAKADQNVAGVEDYQIVTTLPLPESAPMLIDLLEQAQFIGPAEVQALTNQMNLYPDISLVDLVLQAGYVTDSEMKSIQLAEYLISSGKITIQRFSNIMFDERTKRFFPPDDPLEPSLVPRRPRRNLGEGGIALPLPTPPQTDPEP